VPKEDVIKANQLTGMSYAPKIGDGLGTGIVRVQKRKQTAVFSSMILNTEQNSVDNEGTDEHVYPPYKGHKVKQT